MIYPLTYGHAMVEVIVPIHTTICQILADLHCQKANSQIKAAKL